MILITNRERTALEKAGLLTFKHKEKGNVIVEGNAVTVNKCHSSRSKHTYVSETPEVMAFLGRFGEMNLQNIRPDQLETLKEKGYVKDENIQYYGEYKPEATVFVDRNGKIHMKRITAFMLACGFWKK